MSKIIVGKLDSPNHVIEIPAGHKLTAERIEGIPGRVLQVLTVRSDNPVSYSSLNTGDGTTMDELAITMTPKKANSLLIMEYQISWEANHNNEILMHRDGILIEDEGYESYNIGSGNVNYSGIACGHYDHDYSTTQNQIKIIYYCLAKDLIERTYSPATRCSTTTAVDTVTLNRVLNADYITVGREITVSTGIIWEIEQ